MAVTFCGHGIEKEKLLSVDSQLYSIIEKLFLNGQGCVVISGNSMFDKLAARNILLLKSKYPDIRMCKIGGCSEADIFTPVYNKIRRIKCPDSLSHYIAVRESDIVVAYVKNNCSTAHKVLRYAIKQEKDIIRV